ncbi:MAG: hypothetical protein GEU80_00820 [Dehalococcoidia bacterium]|nr:hypothetical protein [Dehalococcoidia bacterium]
MGQMRRLQGFMGVLAIVALAGVLVACNDEANAGGAPDRTPTGTPVGDVGYPTKVAPAPIDDAELLIRESFPPQYAVLVTSGLPSGCAEFESIDVERDGTKFEVTVLNRIPDSDDVACTMIYGTVQNTVELGSDLVSGTEYTVDINDGAKVLTFTAQ